MTMCMYKAQNYLLKNKMLFKEVTLNDYMLRSNTSRLFLIVEKSYKPDKIFVVFSSAVAET